MQSLSMPCIKVFYSQTAEIFFQMKSYLSPTIQTEKRVMLIGRCEALFGVKFTHSSRGEALKEKTEWQCLSMTVCPSAWLAAGWPV